MKGFHQVWVHNLGKREWHLMWVPDWYRPDPPPPGAALR